MIIHVYYLILFLWCIPAYALQESSNAFDYWMQTVPYFEADSEQGDSSEPVFSNADAYLLTSYLDGPMRPPTPEEQRALQRAQPILDLLAQASNADFYDAGLDFAEGYLTPVPHLSPMRKGHTLLEASLRAHAANGESEKALQVMAQLNALSSHAAQDGTVISSLISGSQFENADNHMAELIGAGLIDQDNAMQLLESLDPFTGIDPLNLSVSMGLEETIMLDILDQLIEENPENHKEMLSQIGFDMNGELSSEELIADRNLTETIFDAIQIGLSDSDPVQANAAFRYAEELIEEKGASETGILFELMPSFQKIMEFRSKFQDRFDQRYRQLEALAYGRITPSDLINAAPVWLAAGAAAGQLPNDIQRACVALLNAEKHLRQEEIAPMVNLWEASTIEHLDALLVAAYDAASISLADFSITDAPPPLINPTYVGDLRAIARVLLADASLKLYQWKYSLNSGDDQELMPYVIDALRGAENIRVVMTLIQHLVNDPNIAHSILAAGIFSDTTSLLLAYVETLETHQDVPDDEIYFDGMIRSSLRASLDAIPRADIFSLRAGLNSNREELLKKWSHSSLRMKHPEEHEHVVRFLDSCTFDQIATISAGLNHCGPINSLDGPLTPPLTEEERDRQIASIQMHAEHSEDSLLTDVSDMLPLTPPGLGDGERRYQVIKNVRLQKFKDQPDMRTSLETLNITPIAEFELFIREHIAELSDVEKELRDTSVFPSRPSEN